MGNSTISVATMFDIVAGKGIPDPRQLPSGFGAKVSLQIAGDVMSDLIAERFNWKWNRRTIAAPFYTNSYQQDYPLKGITDLGWLEDCDRVDINNTSMPKPIKQLTTRRQLSRTSLCFAPVSEICWMYNNQLSFGAWPGASQVFSPLVAAQTKQNPIMSMVDVNGNLLIVTTFGTTGITAPAAPAASAEGVTVTDGSVVWTVVSPVSQGFRFNSLPGGSGPVYQIIPYYQMKPPAITTLQALINPIPDDSAGYFLAGVEAYCLGASPNPGDRARFADARAIWMKAMTDIRKQGDREPNSYGMLPASSVVEDTYSGRRNPQDPSQPF